MALTLRSTKGSALTYAEMDANWSGLSNGTNWGTITAAVTISGGLTISAGNLTISTGQLNFSTSNVVQEAADTIAQRNGVNAQAFRIYNTFTDASNYERGSIRHDVNGVIIGHEVLGTGVAKRIQFETSAVIRWCFNAAGDLVPLANNTYDLASTSLRVRTGYFGTSVVTPAVTVSAAGGLTLSATSTPTGAGTGTTGQITWDTGFLYLCTATNDWRRVALVDF